jgi:PadR family transcriptional regulator, regulatory protein PadR
LGVSQLQNDKDQITKGTLLFAVLVSLNASSQYGAELLEALGNTPFKTQAGTLYPLLNKLLRDGLIKYKWVESPVGPPRKYYKLTKPGIEHLTGLKQHWAQLNNYLGGKND